MCFVVIGGTEGGAAIIRVDQKARGSQTGASWANAYRTLQPAIDRARAGDEIWVARGTYWPTRFLIPGESDPRSRTFILKGGVSIYGGFAGNEVERSARDVESNPTVLSGDFRRNDPTTSSGQTRTKADNAYHVAVAINQPRAPVLDGIVLRGGHANHRNYLSSRPLAGLPAGISLHKRGGGLLVVNSSLVIRNADVHSNSSGDGGGGAIFAYNTNKKKSYALSFTDTVFSDNYTLGGEGGVLDMDSDWSSAGGILGTFKRCAFLNNQARTLRIAREIEGGDGGVVNLENATVNFGSCVFQGNRANGGGLRDAQGAPLGIGGVVHAYKKSRVRLVNCLLTGNRSDRFGAALGATSGPDFEVYFSTFHDNVCTATTGWGAGAIGGWYNPFKPRFDKRNSLRGLGNIFYLNETPSAVQIRWVGDNGHLRPARSETPPAIQMDFSVIPAGSLSNNIGTILGGTPSFEGLSNPAGNDGMFFTADDGFHLSLADAVARDQVSGGSLPNDFADLDDDGNYGEALPVDIRGSPMGLSPWNAGCYQ